MTDPMYPTPPVYRHPKSLILAMAWSALAGRPRRLSADAARIIGHAPVPPRVERADLIPMDQPFIVVVNHYHRPGLGVWWGPLLVSYAVAAHLPPGGREMHWGMGNRWTYPPGDRFGRYVMEPLTAAFFPRVAQVLGIVPMPPMPPRPHEAAMRAHAVREFLSLARDPEALIGLAPEGRDSPDGTLITPPPGLGRFMLQLTRTGRLVLPAGIFERGDGLVARFGSAFRLRTADGLSKEAADRAASTEIMLAIGRLLPSELWGEYRADLAATNEFAQGRCGRDSGQVSRKE